MQGDTSDRILALAKSLIANGGYAGFSYADIAEGMNIRKASIHHHFATKTELAVAVVRRHREETLAGVASISENIPQPLKRLRAYTQYWEKCIEDGNQTFCIAALLAAELPGLPSEVAAELRLHFSGLKAWMRSVLDAGVKNHTIRLQGSLDIEADAFMASVHGALLASRVSGTADNFREVTSSAIKKLTAPRQ